MELFHSVTHPVLVFINRPVANPIAIGVARHLPIEGSVPISVARQVTIAPRTVAQSQALPLEAAAAVWHGLTEDADENGRDALESFEADFLNRLACHSAAIEGSTLDALQTQLVLEGEFVPADNKELSDLFAVRGVAEGYDWARREMAKGRRIDAEFIKDIHERTALDAQPRVRGTYRSAAVLIVGAPFTPPAPLEIAPNMDLLLEQFAASSQHPLVSAAAFHAMFEMVHPFLDGNGRVGRTVLNLMLLKAGLPAVALKSNNRLAYLETLAAWQTTGNGADFIAILTENVEAELEARREILTESMG